MSVRTAAAAVVILAAALLAWWWWPRAGVTSKEPVHTQDRYIPPAPEPLVLPPAPFAEIHAEAELDFRHATGGFRFDDGGESRYLPECMGPGVVLFDPDGDGDEDIFVPNGCAFPGRSELAPVPTARWYENQGGFRFADRTEAVGLAITAYGMGGAAADYDGDFDQDLLVTTWGGPRLFRNERGEGGDGGLRFVEVTQEAGLATPGWTDAKGRTGPEWATAAAFFDADQDGDIDLYVANYVKWSPEVDVFTTIDGVRKSFTIPDRYEGCAGRLFLNEGAGRFRDATAGSGIDRAHGKSLGVAVWDFDDDGRLDLAVSNDTQPNFLFLNRGGGRFEEAGLKWGIAYDENARTRAGMGIDAAEYRNDGVVGVPIGNFANEPVALYRREAPGMFRDVTQQAGVAAVTQLALTFGVLFADVDLDGFQDLVLANGHLEPEIAKVQKEVTWAQAPILLRNLGTGRFADWGAEAGPPFSTPIVGRGLATADLDGDGDLDVVLSTNGDRLRLFRNDGDTRHNGLRVRLRGRPPNTDALGAWITLEAGGRTQRRLVRTGSSYLSQSELVQTFGLGAATTVDRLEVRWPSGTETTLTAVSELDRVLTLSEPER